MKNKGKIIGFVAGSALLLASTSASYADIVIGNSNYNNSYGYSLSGHSTSSSNNTVTTKPNKDNQTNNNQSKDTTTGGKSNNSNSSNTSSGGGYYYVSPYNSNNGRSNSVSLSSAKTYNDNVDNKNSNTSNQNNTNNNSGTTYNPVDTGNSNSGVIIDNSNSGGSNSYTLPKATKPATDTVTKKPSEEVLSSLPDYELTSEKQTLLNLINKERVAAGLNPLKIDPDLTRIAQLKSQDMYDNSYFSHESPVFGKTSSLIRKQGIRYYSYGENIGRTYSVYRAHNGFMNSPGHKANIMNPNYTHIGLGIVGNYYTEVFIQK
ncbi:CAP domain-containing protein [Sporosalibacterium faouarense]|uniref:CAP domain-containing protein n=1 Tax=Sporosalibacterium faouarense TaxID=516123 RepID=UPI00192B8236|nr:CAP domain-containing protein [Sporosalibacterium faouarense]